MKPGKKKAAILQARIDGYNKTIQGSSDKAKQFTCPGSNKKS